jgi:AraC-like DNA-binding protein
VRSPHFRLRAVPDGDELRLAPVEQLPLPDAERRALRDLVLLSTQGLLEAALGHPLHAARFELPEPAPRDRGRLADWFRAPLRFGRPEAALVVPARWLRAACPLADAGAFATSVERLAADRHRVDAASDWPTRVAAQLATQPGQPDAAGIARRFGVSRRTLERRLADAGTTYRDLADAHRRRRAELLLRDSSLGVAEIAWALGYEDGANFGRACRRWFGVAPGMQRSRLRGAR